MMILLAFSALALAADGCKNYCLGIRGNGEAVPATLSAMSRMVEEHGIPRSMAGGSSATVAMFLLDASAGNPSVKALQGSEQHRRTLGLMLKSMPEFMAAMASDSKVADGFGMMQAFAGADKNLARRAVEAFQNAGRLSPRELQEALAKYGPLLNPELVALVKKDPVRFGPEAVKSVKNLGAFNAVTDDSLFFRPGLIDFRSFALTMGVMADFYAGNTDPETRQRLDAYARRCAGETHGKEWGDAPADCREEFHKIAADYLKAGRFQHKAVFGAVGRNAESLPTTSLLQGAGVKKYLAEKAEYEAGRSNGKDFSIDFEKEMSFGYWGPQGALNKAESGLKKFRDEGDLRAKKFRSLGPGSWFEVLATSPAEPGIANCQRVPSGASRQKVLAEAQKPIEKRWEGLSYRKDVLSCGGWSDLQPTMIERARGCRPVIYLTRQAAYGDSKFGQQVFIRLTGDTNNIPFWEKIGESGPSGWCNAQIRQGKGDPETVRITPWSRISNLCDPKSSFRRALDNADAVYCTDWDNPRLGVPQGQMRPLIREAYNAPLIPTTAEGAGCKLNRQPASLDPRALPSCLPFPSKELGSSEAGRDGSGFVAPAQ